MKHALLIAFFGFASLTFFGQTLARYGNQKISREEFLKAFQKNNVHEQPTTKSYRDYLTLYIRYRLKVQAALDIRLDTLPEQVSELQNFKNQIADQYADDEAGLQQMVKESFARSQKDLHLLYIIVPVASGASPEDTTLAWKKINEAYLALQNNQSFQDVAVKYSGDPFVKNNKGELNWITVFDLPYNMETVAYNAVTGKTTLPFRIESGYVILKKTGVRPAAGKIRIEQILMAFPYQADDSAKKETRKRADSIYKAVTTGSNFENLAKKFSGDNLSYQLGGALPEFGIGKYEYGFENTAYDLKKDGDISLPYESAFGYHIIKRIKRIPVSSVADQKTSTELKEKIKLDPRISMLRKQMSGEMIRQTGMKEYVSPGIDLWNYTDSLLQNKKPSAVKAWDLQTVVWKFPYRNYTLGDWITYRKSLKSMPAMTNNKTNAEIFASYKQSVVFEYYKTHLENYNAEYAAQINEFRDGNLLFEIMQRQVWTKASADSLLLKKYFETHQQTYWWKPGAEAILFHCANASVAKNVREALKKNINAWRSITDSLGTQVQADSGRFEWQQLPPFTNAGGFTSAVNNSDNSVQFAYITKQYPETGPRSFEEARGLVINDFQNELENEWIDRLKIKYPVEINEQVFKSLPK